ncbi:MAG: hypothetical protein VZR11_13225, partial [Succinimonas sp.]|nr:hypothetical protein [Succinimonas sp.]
MEIQIVSRENLSHIIERASLNIPPETTIADIMLRECPAYAEDIARKSYLTLTMDGVRIPPELW